MPDIEFIELKIKIPKETYTDVINERVLNISNANIWNAIKNGKLLKKREHGMMIEKLITFLVWVDTKINKSIHKQWTGKTAIGLHTEKLGVDMEKIAYKPHLSDINN